MDDRKNYLGTTTLHREAPCPACSHPLDAAGDPGGRGSPDGGDVSVCINCGAFLTFNPDLTLRLVSLFEIGELPDDVRIELQRHRKIIEELNR